MWRHVGSLAAVLLLGWAQAGCSATHHHGTPVVSATASRSSVASSGIGTASITVGGVSKKFDVTCTRSAATTQATGSEGSDELSLTVVGSPVAVLVSHGVDGSTTIYQAIPGLRDDSGKASASVSVMPNGDSYKGTATFVLTRIDSKGSRAHSAGANTDSGTFDVECRNGYLSPPSSGARSGTSSPSSGARSGTSSPSSGAQSGTSSPSGTNTH